MIQSTQSFTIAFRRLLEKRNLRKDSEIESFLFSGLESLHDPLLMKNMKEVVSRLEHAIAFREKIFIHGDYDVDGITGVAILAQTLEKRGGQYQTFLPERERDGYGVSEAAVRKAHENGAKLILTVDCGITAKKEIEMARLLGMDVIVIDHHRLPAEGLPGTHLILNPLQEDCAYPFKELSAAGLAFKLSQALLGNRALEFLDLVALSTISDIAPLTGENRILVKEGLKLLSQRKNLGLRALGDVAKMKAQKIDTGHVGFILGPRLNAAGRMSSPDTALQLILTQEPREAESLARILNEENKVRQQYEKEITREAIRKVEREVNFNREKVLVVEGKNWHLGVIGIVASRLVEKFERPAIVISVNPKGEGRGSGRSIKGFHLFNALQASQDILAEFGGHEQAVGLAMQEKNIPQFRKTINAYATENLSFETLGQRVAVDLEVKLGDLTNHLLEELELLEPYGAGNPRPIFQSQCLRIQSKARKLYGETYEIIVSDGYLNYQAQADEKQMLQCVTSSPATRFDAAYSVRIKEWNGIRTLTLVIKNLQPV